MIDYAFPTMMAEKALKDLHYAMLKNDYKEAIEAGVLAVIHAQEAIQSIKIMQEDSLKK
jgi:hypothetical protein